MFIFMFLIFSLVISPVRKICAYFWLTQYELFTSGFFFIHQEVRTISAHDHCNFSTCVQHCLKMVYYRYYCDCRIKTKVCSENTYWVTQKLPQICTVILRILIGKVAWFAVYICGNFWVTQYIPKFGRSEDVSQAPDKQIYFSTAKCLEIIG